MPKQGWAGRLTSNTFNTLASRLNVSCKVVIKLRSLILPSLERCRPMGARASFILDWHL